jgi:hypothetical protein
VRLRRHRLEVAEPDGCLGCEQALASLRGAAAAPTARARAWWRDKRESCLVLPKALLDRGGVAGRRLSRPERESRRHSSHDERGSTSQVIALGGCACSSVARELAHEPIRAPVRNPAHTAGHCQSHCWAVRRSGERAARAVYEGGNRDTSGQRQMASVCRPRRRAGLPLARDLRGRAARVSSARRG